MFEHLLTCVALLRRCQVEVSLTESIDAANALHNIALWHRAFSETELRTVLRATLIKHASDLPLFNFVFDAVFVGRIVDENSQSNGRDTELNSDVQLTNKQINAILAALAGMSDGRYLGMEYHVRRAKKRLLHAPGLFVSDETEDLASVRLHQANADTEKEIRQRLTAVLSATHGEDWLINKAAPKRCAELDLLRLSEAELAALRHEVDLLGRRLAARLTKKRQAKNYGRLLIAPTLRRSLSTGGVPVVTVFKTKQRRRPDVVVLADVSGSVSTFARFSLQLVSMLQRQFHQLRTFAFIDEIDEITDKLRLGFDDAINELNARAQTAGYDGHSNYGAVFEAFHLRWQQAIRPTTSVLILGDARNNYHEVRSEALRAITANAKATYWLNPEPQRHWDTADSVISRYSQHCNAVFECRNLKQLASVIDKIN